MNLTFLNHFNKTFANSGLIEIFLYFSNCSTCMLDGDFSDSIETGCILFVFLPNKIEQIGSIEIDWFN